MTDVIAVVGGIRVSKTDANNAIQDTDIMISGGGGGGSADGVAESVDLAVNGSNLILTVGRSLGLADLADSVALPAGLTNSDVDARIATYARVSPSGTIATAQLPSANALDSELPDVSDFITATDVDGVFDAVAFSNGTRDLTFGHYGSGTSTIPLDYLDATQDARPGAITSVTVEQGDEVILSGGVYKHIGSVVATFAKTAIAADDDFVQIDASGGGLTIEDSGTEEGTGITTLNFGANLGVSVTGTTADIAGQAGGGGGLSSVSSNATLDGDGTAADPLGVADEGVDTAQLADDAVTQAKLANNSVHAAQIGANAVGSSEISASAVGTSELADNGVTEAKIADSAVGFQQLAANSVRVDEIQANAVGHSEMQDAAVGVAELRDDAADRLCPDPTSGTNGQVCATNGTAYELVDQSGGGGGGGTDDQTAAEVPVTATGFTGNLSATDTDVQTALDTIDGFTLGGGGGGGTGTASVVAFKCALTDIASASYSSDTQILECEATPSINEGVFVVEDASGTDTTDRVVIPEDGLYELIVSLYVDNGTGTRTTPHVSFTVESGGVVTTLADEGTGYIRGSQGGQDEGAVDHTSIVELLADDRIGLVVRQEGTPNITIEGAQSFLAIVKAGGAVGAVGPVGPAGADGSGTGDITAVNTAGTSDG